MPSPSFTVLTFYFIGTVIFITISGTAKRSSYGEACSRFQRCNSKAFINCANGHFCDCIKPSSMIFDESLGKCGNMVGERCSMSAQQLHKINEPPCVSNAKCENSICKCLPEYIPLLNGTCEKKKGHGANCTTDDVCQSIFVCGSEGSCTCENGKVYNQELDICTWRVGETCSSDETCPEFSSCNPANSTCSCILGYFETEEGTCQEKATDIKTISTCTHADDCKPDQDCLSFKCVCGNGTKFNGEYCHVEHGDPCLSDTFGSLSRKTCLPELMCRNNTCECPYKDHQEFNKTEGRCLSLIAGPCNKTEDCIRDANCVTENGLKSCHCNNGFNPVDRRCELAYGEKCVPGDDVRRCDRLGPLECSSNGKCNCSDFQTYDEQRLKCRGLVGAKCNQTDLTFCVDGAHCKAFRGFNTGFGVCTCTSVSPSLSRYCSQTE